MLKLLTFARLHLALILPLASVNLYAAELAYAGYKAVAGGKLYYQTFGSKGENIVVLHGGLGLDSSYLLPQMAKLALTNKVTFYDQRGCGKSLGFALTPENINLESFINDLETLRQQLGFEKFTLIGHSLGGLLAMNYAIAYQQHLNALILLNSAPATSSGFKIFLKEHAKRTAPLQNELDLITNSPAYKYGQPAARTNFLRKLFAAYFYKPAAVNKLSLNFTPGGAISGSKVAELLVANYLTDYDVSAGLKTLTLPVLIVHGKNDIVPLATAYEIKALLVNAQLVVIPKCDHFPYIEQPLSFFKTLDEFLNKNK